MIRSAGEHLDEIIRMEIKELEALNSTPLKRLWRETMGDAPFLETASAKYLQRGLAYRLQEQAAGGLSMHAREKLQQLAARHHEETVKRRAHLSTPRATLPAGTLLRREWHGHVHEVKSLETGFLYKEKTYGSLSAIARAITGTRWSGPAFFGLKKKKTTNESHSAS